MKSSRAWHWRESALAAADGLREFGDDEGTVQNVLRREFHVPGILDGGLSVVGVEGVLRRRRRLREQAKRRGTAGVQGITTRAENNPRSSVTAVNGIVAVAQVDAVPAVAAVDGVIAIAGENAHVRVAVVDDDILAVADKEAVHRRHGIVPVGRIAEHHRIVGEPVVSVTGENRHRTIGRNCCRVVAFAQVDSDVHGRENWHHRVVGGDIVFPTDVHQNGVVADATVDDHSAKHIGGQLILYTAGFDAALFTLVGLTHYDRDVVAGLDVVGDCESTVVQSHGDSGGQQLPRLEAFDKLTIHTDSFPILLGMYCEKKPKYGTRHCLTSYP